MAERCLPSVRVAFCPFDMGCRRVGIVIFAVAGAVVAAGVEAVFEAGIDVTLEAGAEAAFAAGIDVTVAPEGFRELMDDMLFAVTMAEVFKVLREDRESRSSAPVVCIGI